MNNYRFISKCIIALLFCIIGLTSCRDKIPTNEIHYTTIDNSVLPIEDFSRFGEGRIVSNSYDPSKNVCILKLDKDVTEIGWDAFSGCSSLTSIAIPQSVTQILPDAFSGCSSLTSISIPPSVTAIGWAAFSGCSSLTSITIPKSVTDIGMSAFSGCSSLTSITIPPSVTKIRIGTFRGCSSLTEVRIPKGCNVHELAFYESPNVQIIRY